MKKRLLSMLLLFPGMLAYGETSDENTYNGIPVEVIGVPYDYRNIRGNHTLDYVIDEEYKLRATGIYSTFVNFKFVKFVFDFKQDGSLILSSVISYDETLVGNGASYPANPNHIHEWVLTPKDHTHNSKRCSLDRYDDIAIAQGTLNEMRKDASLDKIYEILLSVATDMDYNYPAIGRQAKFITPTQLVGVCDDYTNLMIDRLTRANISGVRNIQKVTGQNHAWVTLQYRGQVLYLDATWFDKNVIDETGTVVHTPHKDPRNMTFDSDIFTNHGIHHLPE